MALLTLAQQNSFKPISQNWANEVKVTGGRSNFTQMQEEVEEKELRKLLGAKLLYDIQQNPLVSKYVDLLDGKEFSTDNGDTLKFKGLRYILSYMNYSKYLEVSSVKDTFVGFVQKQRNESIATDRGSIKSIQKDVEEIALQDFEIMKIYLNDNDTLYPLWECNIPKYPFKPKIYGINKTKA